jgi:hypothetical protein
VRWADVAEANGLTGAVQLDATRDPAKGLLPSYSFEPPLQGALDVGTAAALVEVLSTVTATPEDVFFGIWIGWGDTPPERFPGAGVIATEGRGHFLLRGPLEGALTAVAVADTRGAVSGLWWPADRTWFVATEVDLEWTFVAGERVLIDRLMAHGDLEVVPTSRDSAVTRLTDS